MLNEVSRTPPADIKYSTASSVQKLIPLRRDASSVMLVDRNGQAKLEVTVGHLKTTDTNEAEQLLLGKIPERLKR